MPLGAHSSVAFIGGAARLGGGDMGYDGEHRGMRRSSPARRPMASLGQRLRRWDFP
jgi:hypothetical protein